MPFLDILMSHVQANLRTLGSDFAGNTASTDFALLDDSWLVSCDTAAEGDARAPNIVEAISPRIYSETSFQRRDVKAMPHEVAISSSISLLMKRPCPGISRAGSAC